MAIHKDSFQNAPFVFKLNGVDRAVQVTKFGEKLSNYLQIPYLENELVRVSATKTQTFKARFERFNNVDTKFLLKNPLFFNNKHILLIDDVITTGATIESCAKEITVTVAIETGVSLLPFASW